MVSLDGIVTNVHEGLANWGFGEYIERLDGNVGILPGCLERVFNRVVTQHQLHSHLKVAVILLAEMQRPRPELLLVLRSAFKSDDDGKSNFALFEILANVLAERVGRTAIVEGIVDNLKRDTEVVAIGPQSLRFLGIDGSNNSTQFSSGSEELSCL